LIQIFELCSFIATAAPPPPTPYEDATVNPTASPTHAYNYDPVGNRTSVLEAGVTTNYTTNSVNAYTNISGGGILPPSQNPTYDPNGNMLTGPVGTAAASLTYDNEHARRLVGRAEFAEQSPERGDFPMLGKNHQNRLRTITQNGTTTGYTYDALSRCIETLMNNPRTARSPWGHVTHVPVQNAYMPSAFFNNTSPTDNRERYTWSGWTLLNRELFTGTTPTSSFRYTWGLDLSGRQEGAGGVGGLLAIERIVGSNTEIRFPHYDANGNIIALTDSAGNVSARHRYDAFGKTLSATDLDNSNWVTHNINGFSTKPTLGTPDLLYYGYRFYTPSLGRWINRDPIEEKGGVNLYGFVGNAGVGKWDILGKKPSPFDFVVSKVEWSFVTNQTGPANGGSGGTGMTLQFRIGVKYCYCLKDEKDYELKWKSTVTVLDKNGKDVLEPKKRLEVKGDKLVVECDVVKNFAPITTPTTLTQTNSVVSASVGVADGPTSGGHIPNEVFTQKFLDSGLQIIDVTFDVEAEGVTKTRAIEATSTGNQNIGKSGDGSKKWPDEAQCKTTENKEE
jgi:RHS repeat-associated protein